MSWEKAKFGSLFSTPTRNGVYKNKEAHGEGVKIVNMGEIFGYDFIGNQEMQRIVMSENEMKVSGLQKNDLLFARRSLVESGAGKASIVLGLSEPTTFESSIIRVRLNSENCFPLFYFYWLRSHAGRTAIGALVTGTNVKGIRGSALKDIDVDYPDIDTQRRIADVLMTYDNLIENNQKQIKLLEEAAQRLYKEWFVDLRFPGWENTKIVDGVPEGWKKKTVSDIGQVITGKTPTTSRKEYYDGEIPFVTIPDMHDTIYPIHTERTLSSEGANSQKGKLIPIDSIMVSCIATVGLVNISLTDCQTNQQINSIILKDKEMLYYTYCSMKRIKALLDGVGSNGATMTNVNKSKFENIEVLLPPTKLQQMFYDFCAPIFGNIKALSFSIDNAKQARDRLLPKLMSGELEV